MWIIIDGYNLIRQWPELAMLDRTDLEAGREALLVELAAYRRAKAHRITVVFDGRERGGFSESGEQARGIAVRYSRQGETADEVIDRLAAGSGQGTAVVSSDHAVQAAARRHGAVPIASAEFILRVEAARLADIKREEGEERPQKTGKGAARRLPKAERRAQQRLRDL